ncbi:MAG: hypothetical protein LBR14_05020 [Clostridiales Family XIII bacterium]|nr:hypothetical protein [Clostridiales Family XIII bacterium]
MIKKYFVEKLICCVVVVAALFTYTHIMRLDKQLEAAAADVEQLNAELLAANEQLEALARSGVPTAATSTSGGYIDGVYTGTGQGAGGPVTSQVTIENGYIVKIDILSADGETEDQLTKSLAVVDEILAQQSAAVSPVPEAVETSAGIIDSVSYALVTAVPL